MTALDGPRFWAIFENFRRSAWRWEAQPAYSIPDEQADLARFLAGEPEPPGHNSDWHEEVRAWAAEGKRVSRVRAITPPLTDYQRYQLAWGIPGNVRAGEDVRVLDLSMDPTIVVPQRDFWIFDDVTVVHLDFSPDGVLLGRVLVEDPDLDMYHQWRDLAMSRAVPVREWSARP
ncbi:hypothetical protein NLX83_04020 [Allokutzneria sp. A3M-2-11 16]|uniref:DUF6879 family protein n=1 Tax=Allokutzneria sp. A3M-2-11 16 TaxID=2962043 RepID=UPI0020B7A327|nr:DUF6879 family protein [Allokutzneria sp. A3M-2-11 16]MCP3798420.1 hypothetical protein [Allokutzneria sp. A3M-2-11 16]